MSIALFAVHSDSELTDCRIQYINMLLQCVDEVLVITTNAAHTVDINGARIMHHPNLGLDFGLWKAGLSSLTREYTFMILANDGCTIVRPLIDSVNKMRLKQFSGYTDSFDHKHHIQSYFLTFSGRAVKLLLAFFQTFNPFGMSRDDIIHKGEIGLSQYMREHKIAIDAMYPWKSINVKPKFSNSSWFHYEELMQMGCPLLKRKRHEKKVIASVKVFILAFNSKSFDIAQKTALKFTWAEAYLLKPMTPSTALWEHSFFLDMPDCTTDYIGILGYKCETRSNLIALDKRIREGLTCDVLHLNLTNVAIDKGYSKGHPHFKTIWKDVLEPLSMPITQASEAYYSHFLCRRNIMEQYASTIKSLSKTLLAHPLILHNAMYPGTLSKDMLKASCGVEWYPHTPFLLERFMVPYFVSQGYCVESLTKLKVLGNPTAKNKIVPYEAPCEAEVRNVVHKNVVHDCCIMTVSNVPSQVLKATPCGSLMPALESALSAHAAALIVADNKVMCASEVTLLKAIKEATEHAESWDFASFAPSLSMEFLASPFTMHATEGKRVSENYFLNNNNFYFETFMVSKRGLQLLQKEGLRAINCQNTWVFRFALVSKRGQNMQRVTLELGKLWKASKQ